MSLEVQMPQMGESIAEGTLVRWLKKPGDVVKRDEPLFEISTDKVDTEIPSPGEGVLGDIRVEEGQTVPVNTVVCVLTAAGESGAAASAAPPAQEVPVAHPPAPAPPSPAEASIPAASPVVAVAPALPVPPSVHTDEGSRQRSSPLVRKIAQEEGVDVSLVHGTGASGRVTKKDILDYIAARQGVAPATSVASAALSTKVAEAATEVAPRAAPQPSPAKPARDESGVRIQPMSNMRVKIAEHMIMSRRTSAHVTTVHEVDMTEVARVRQANKKKFLSENGVKLTFLPFLIKAVVSGLREFPVLNTSLVENQIHYHRNVNMGIAVALDDGLIVPVIKDAEEKSILGLARAIQDLAERSRTKRLAPQEVLGGTFTISNYGSFGTILATPIINQPQVAILGVGAAVKRPVVLPGTDAIAIRSMTLLSLTFDHRLIDGATADRFLARVRTILEGPVALS